LIRASDRGRVETRLPSRSLRGGKQAAQQLAPLGVLVWAVNQAHGRVQVPEVMIAEIGQAHMPEPGPEVQLDRFPVTGQRARLQLGVGLPPAEPPGQIVAERGPPVLDVGALTDTAQCLYERVLALVFGPVWT